MSSFLFKEEWNKEKDVDSNALKLKSLRKNLRVLPQVGTTNREVDASKHALMSGKRISRNGNVYWETRKNRSDARGSNI